MKISLKKFESEIGERIVSRGEEYFESDAVRGLKKIKDDQWVASVDGTETYKVCISLKGDSVEDYSCSCPYDLGPVCKHVVAVLYALRDQQEEGQDAPVKGKASSLKIRPKQPEETLEQIIARMSRQDLNTMLLAYAGRDTNFTDYVFAQQTLRSPASNKEQYHRIIQNTVDAAKGRDGFIGYWESSKAPEGAEMLLDKAEKLINQGEYQKALPIYQCVVHEMVPVLQEADDSNGVIGDTIQRGFQGLSICAGASEGETYRQEMFDYLFDEFEDRRYEGWSDWKWDFLEMAAQMVNTPQEQKRLFDKAEQFLKKRDKGDGWSRRDEEKVLNIKLTVVRRCGSVNEADDFLNKNLNHPSMRRQAIEQAFQRKDYEQVKKLAEDGIVLDKQGNVRGLTSEWTDWLLKVAQAKRNVAEIKQHSLALFLDIGREDYYKCYKKCFLEQEWGEEAQRIIGIIKKYPHRRGDGSLPQIYIWEQMWQDLFDMVCQNSSAHMLSAYGGRLASHFPNGLVEIYEKVIVSELAPPVGRSKYQNLCRFLRQMKKLDTQGRVKTLIEELSVKYVNRPAMLEEMKRV